MARWPLLSRRSRRKKRTIKKKDDGGSNCSTMALGGKWTVVKSIEGSRLPSRRAISHRLETPPFGGKSPLAMDETCPSWSWFSASPDSAWKTSATNSAKRSGTVSLKPFRACRWPLWGTSLAKPNDRACLLDHCILHLGEIAQMRFFPDGPGWTEQGKSGKRPWRRIR